MRFLPITQPDRIRIMRRIQAKGDRGMSRTELASEYWRFGGVERRDAEVARMIRHGLVEWRDGARSFPHLPVPRYPARASRVLVWVGPLTPTDVTAGRARR